MIIFKRLLFILATGFLIYPPSFHSWGVNFAYAEWQFSGYGINETYAKIVLVDPQDAKVVYVATDFFLYMSSDEGTTWKEIFTLPGKENTINFAAIARQTIYVASSDGVYISTDNAYNWKQIHPGINTYCIAPDPQDPDILYIAGDRGIFVSDGAWKDIPAKYIIVAPGSNLIYASSDEKIFRSEDKGKSWQEVYSLPRKDTPQTLDAEEPIEDNEEEFVKINSLAADPKDPKLIYAATSKGVLKNFEFMTNSGLDDNVKHILLSADEIYAAAYKGVFRYDKDNVRWAQLYEGASFRDARFLSQSADGAIWVATGNGIFKTSGAGFTPAPTPVLAEYLLDNFKHEPNIREVQRAAIGYAEVHPDKIKNWRKEARMKALLPEFDLDYDKNVYMGASTFYVGPRDWGIGLKWDVGDIVFSDDQTNIDVRSRLMVQLRDDILDDVTRLYYERRRLQVEMLTSPPKSEKEKMDKLLRIEELTAGIDGLTGGYFSDRL